MSTTDHDFLGEEFLTWLWFRLETEGGDFELDGNAVGVSLDDLLAFAPDDRDETEHTLRKGLPTRTAEARAALRSGRRLRKAKLILAEGEQQWSLTVDGPTLNLQGVKLPDDPEDQSVARDVVAERIANYARAHELVELLYGQFLAVRLHPDYKATRATAQAQWMSGA